MRKKVMIMGIAFLMLCTTTKGLASTNSGSTNHVKGTTITVDLGGKNGTEGGYISGSSERNNDESTDSSDSSGTKVTVEQQKAYDSRKAAMTSIKGLQNKIKQKKIGDSSDSIIYAGKGKLSKDQKSALMATMDLVGQAMKENGTEEYNTNGTSATFKGGVTLTADDKEKFKEALEETSEFKETTGKSLKNKGVSASDIPQETDENGTYHEVPKGYGDITLDGGKINLNNNPEQKDMRIGDFQKYCNDLFKNGVLDSKKYTDRTKTLQNYLNKVLRRLASVTPTANNTCLEDIDDIAYVTAYTISEKDSSYYNVTDYNSKKRRWKVVDSNGAVVKSGVGEITQAKFTLDDPGKYKFIGEQEATVITGTAIKYYQREYMVLIPTNTLLYFNEVELGPIVLNEKRMTNQWVKVVEKEYNIKGLNEVETETGIERME